jgi:hypothetical protein
VRILYFIALLKGSGESNSHVFIFQGEKTTMRTRLARACTLAAACISGYCVGVPAQTITFNSPAPWLTLRNDSLIVKAQLDTSKFPKKKITLAANKIEGNKKKQIAAKTFTVADFTQDFSLGLAGTGLIGGRDFLRINWSVPGAKDSGSCAPIGIANIDKLPKCDTLHAAKSAEEVGANSFAAAAKSAKFTKVKDQEFALLWTPTALVVLCKKASTGLIRLVIDGKNGKNAFVAYSDKMVDIAPAKDSVYAFYNERSFADSITYKQKQWVNEFAKASDKEISMVNIPWYDIGIGKPFDGRVTGFSVFVLSDKGAMTGAYPEKAAMMVPGSWGNLVLDK